MRIEVKPIETKKWHGKKGKEAFFEPKVSQVLYDPITGKYRTGLTKEEAEKWGKELGIDLSDNFNPEEEHPFWSSKRAQIKLENKTMVFNTTNTLDAVKVKTLKVCHLVANSIKELEEGRWPDATHVIYDESDEVEVKANSMQKTKKAIQLLSKLTADQQVGIIMILEGKNLKGRSANFLDAAMGKIIEEKVDEFIRYAEMDSKEVYAISTVHEALHNNILTKDLGAVYYMSEKIGLSFDDAVKWFMDPNNQTTKAAIISKLNPA